ncbi:MAG: cyclopropane-fatty-acyl-phospholipid synthase family protein [Magnetospirillum sp.]
MPADPVFTDPWDQRFASPHYLYGQAPNAFLADMARHLPTGAQVLLPGDGEGRNAAHLAGLGHQVLSVDRSVVGLQKARQLAESRGHAIQTAHADLAHWTWPRQRFDAVFSIFLHLPSALRAPIHAQMVEAMKPGGLLVLEAFRPEQIPLSSGGPKDVDLLYTVADLRTDFAVLRDLRVEAVEATLDEGPLHQGQAALVRVVGRKQ